MRDEEKLPLLMGRMIDLLRNQPDAVDDQKATLKGIGEITSRRSVTLRNVAGTLRVEGHEVSPDLPLAGQLITQMEAHRVVELRISFGAPTIDILLFLRGIAQDLLLYGRGYSVERRLRELGVSGVSVVSPELDAASHERRRQRITEALGIDSVLSNIEDIEVPPLEPPSPISVVTAASGPGYDAMVRGMLASSTNLADTVRHLDLDGAGPSVSRQVDTVLRTVINALDGGQIEQAIEGAVGLIRQEERVESEAARRACAVALERLFTGQTLGAFAPYLLDDLYRDDVTLIMHRAREAGAKVLVKLLVAAPTYAERRAYLEVLRGAAGGTAPIVGMLNHSEWYVVRNMADLSGELKVSEAVPALGKVIGHEDDRVRVSAGVALAKIGTPATVQHLARLLREPDPNVRIAVFREVAGSGQGALAMPIVNALESEDDPDVRAEYYQALGRIGTPDAIGVLKTTATKSTGLLRRSGSDQMAAVEALALAMDRSKGARNVLETLRAEGPRAVREAASKALRN